MTQTSTPTDVARLIQEGRAAALAGDTMVARDRFRRATDIDNTNIDAWIGLSSAVPVLAEKRDYLERALQLDPQNGEAQASLAYVQKLQADGLQLAPSRRAEVRHASGDASSLLSAPEMPMPAATETLYCYRHPNRETGLRCTSCNRPVCGECAQTASVGQLCPECRRARRPPNYQTNTSHAMIGGLLAMVTGAVGSFIVPFVPQFVPFFGLFLAILAGPFVGELTVRLIERVVRKRGRPMQIGAGVGFALGALPMLFLSILSPSLLTLLLGAFVVLAISTMTARFR